MVDDPLLRAYGRNISSHNFCACGLAATGDSAVDETDPGDNAALTAKVQNIKAWHYAKTALALVGLYVIGKYLWTKYKK